jgi:hypothetical protein
MKSASNSASVCAQPFRRGKRADLDRFEALDDRDWILTANAKPTDRFSFFPGIASGDGKMPHNSRKMSHSGSNCSRRLAEKPRHPAQEFPESIGA